MKNYLANLDTVCGAAKFTFAEGKAKGMDCIIAYNGVLNIYLVPDRGLDIYRLEYRGVNYAFISKNGEVNPSLMGSEGMKFMNAFPGGFLYTCGLNNCMGPDIINGVGVPQHGSYTYLPAENIVIRTFEKDASLYVEVVGTIRYSALFGANIEVKRTITLEYNQPRFTLKDEITNRSAAKDSYLIMYHHNIGYPLLNGNSDLWIDSTDVDIFASGSDLGRITKFEYPQPRKKEEVFIHTIGEGFKPHASLTNGKNKVVISWDSEKLPYMVQWKSMASQDYACGIEPTVSKYPEKKMVELESGQRHIYELLYDFD